MRHQCLTRLSVRAVPSVSLPPLKSDKADVILFERSIR